MTNRYNTSNDVTSIYNNDDVITQLKDQKFAKQRFPFKTEDLTSGEITNYSSEFRYWRHPLFVDDVTEFFSTTFDFRDFDLILLKVVLMKDEERSRWRLKGSSELKHGKTRAIAAMTS